MGISAAGLVLSATERTDLAALVRARSTAQSTALRARMILHLADGVNITTPIKVPAPDYIGYLLEWVDGQISNPQLMPTNNEKFPPDFQATAKTIFKRLFRVYAHIYHSHFPQYVTLQLEAHLNTCFKRYVYFVAEFDLVEAKELAPLQQLISSLLPSE